MAALGNCPVDNFNRRGFSRRKSDSARSKENFGKR